MTVKGTIDKNWNINFGTVGGDDATFEGYISPYLKVSGTWESLVWSISGTFTGQCSSKSIIDDSPYCA